MAIKWQDLAKCRGKYRLFFAPLGERPEAREVRITRAKGLCAKCPVQQSCKEAGQDEPWGVWGGQSPRERGWKHASSARQPTRRTG